MGDEEVRPAEVPASELYITGQRERWPGMEKIRAQALKMFGALFIEALPDEQVAYEVGYKRAFDKRFGHWFTLDGVAELVAIFNEGSQPGGQLGAGPSLGIVGVVRRIAGAPDRPQKAPEPLRALVRKMAFQRYAFAEYNGITSYRLPDKSIKELERMVLEDDEVDWSSTAAVFEAAKRREDERGVDETPVPIPMLLFCPLCHVRHIDEGEFATRAHHTHACQGCGLTWRPALVPTVGVQFLPGFKNE